VILVLHTRYRTTGGEERAVGDLAWLARERLAEDVEELIRDSAHVGRGQAARGVLRGGLEPDQVAQAVRRTGADVVHAHNLLPAFGWRALAAAREAGAATVLHLHNYRLVCSVATCIDPAGADCVACQGRDTVPGIRKNCRGARAEGVVYAAGLAAWQTKTVQHADVVVVPSRAAEQRLRALRAPIGDVQIVPHVVRELDGVPHHDPDGPAIVASRLAPEKGIGVAIAACARSGVGLTIAGDGPEAGSLRSLAAHTYDLTVLEGPTGPAPQAGQVRFTGRLDPAGLTTLRSGASVELIPSVAHETFGLAAIEALAAGLPVVASATGALASLPAPVRLVPAGDAYALAAALRHARADPAAAAAGPALARTLAGADVVAPALAAVDALARDSRPRP
jgi:glycosyltransferase involved in cell wall biosynthesis